MTKNKILMKIQNGDKIVISYGYRDSIIVIRDNDRISVERSKPTLDTDGDSHNIGVRFDEITSYKIN